MNTARTQPVFAAICQLWLILSCFFPAAATRSQLPLETPEDTWSRFDRTVHYLQDNPSEQQADFAADALAQLAEVYMAEADLARTEAEEQQGRQRKKLLGWSRAVDQYADQLLLLLDELKKGAPVALLLSREGAASVTVATRAVILGHPRADQQAAFEQRVLVNFCARNDCRRFAVETTELEPIPMSAAQIKPRWTFTETGPVCSHAGIEIRFGNVRELGVLRGACEQLVLELETLANEIAWQQRNGVTVDWTALVISRTPRQPEHLVGLNPAGDSVLVTVPLLFGSPGLIEDIKPWLRQRVAGGEPLVVHLDAASYGWLQAVQ